MEEPEIKISQAGSTPFSVANLLAYYLEDLISCSLPGGNYTATFPGIIRLKLSWQGKK